VFVQNDNSPPKATISIPLLNVHRPGGDDIPIFTNSTTTEWILVVHFGYWVSLIGGQKQQKTQSQYTDISRLVCNMINIIPYFIQVEASILHGLCVNWWGLSKTTGEMHPEQVPVLQFSAGNIGLQSGNILV